MKKTDTGMTTMRISVLNKEALKCLKKIIATRGTEADKAFAKQKADIFFAVFMKDYIKHNFSDDEKAKFDTVLQVWGEEPNASWKNIDDHAAMSGVDAQFADELNVDDLLDDSSKKTAKKPAKKVTKAATTSKKAAKSGTKTKKTTK